MNTAKQVAELLAAWIKDGLPKQDIAWKIALACVGWAYVFGARGEYCDPSNRRARYRDDHPTIKTSCRNFDGTDDVPGKCTSCKWYPGGRTRFFDCRGFVYWVLLQVYGWKLQGAGATSQWNTESNWKAKGEISTMPKDVLCCLFVKQGNKMEHVGFGLNNETVECSVGVQHFTSRNKKWTHWAVPVCVDGSVTPTPAPEPTLPTLRRGDKGPYVTLAQTELMNRGYDVGTSGVDGIFGKATESAVKAFQKDNGLTVDGVIGQKTWAALNSTEPIVYYSVTVPHLTASQADVLIAQYPGSTKTKEGA